MSVNKLLVLVLILCMLIFPTLAVGRSFTPSGRLAPGEYSVNQNPDETWTEYMGSNDPESPIQGETYTSAEMNEAMGNAGYTVDNLGGYSTSSADIVGGNMKEFEAGKALYKNIADGQLYMDMSPAEETIGKWASFTARAEGVLPTLARGLSFAGDVGLAVGAFGLGVEIGNGIDEIFGLGQLGLGGGGSETATLSEPSWIVVSALGGFQTSGICHNRSGGEDPHGGEQISGLGPGNWPTYAGSTEVCVTATPFYSYQRCLGREESEVFKFHCPTTEGAVKEYTGKGTEPGPYGVLDNIYQSESKFCGLSFGGVLSVCYASHYFAGSVSMAEEMMPQPLTKIPTGYEPGETKGPTRAAPEHFPPPVPASVPAPAKVFVLKPEPGIEGKPLPSPLSPAIPATIPGETGTQYKTRVETLGWTSVTLNTLPETATNPRVGPEGVSYTVPSEGTPEPSKATHIDVEQNPKDAPIPAETPNKIGPPTEPGFKLPKFGVLCKGFPFGVPCWLVKTIEGWSATPKAPEWGLEEFSIKGKKVSGSKFHLSQLEPIMEKVRPAILIFVTIGIVLLFYKFAKGGGPEGGSGTGDPNPERYGEPGGPGAENEFR